jgi:TolB-like protein
LANNDASNGGGLLTGGATRIGAESSGQQSPHTNLRASLSFFSELRRRNVFRVAAAYGVVMWLIIQVDSAVSRPLNLPAWFETVVIVLLIIGFPVALVLAWAFELTPDGLRPTQPQDPAAPSTANRLDYVLIGALIVVAAVTLWGQVPRPAAELPPEVTRITEHPSIAVLPFADMSAEKNQEYFGDGIAEELINVLSRLDGLRIAGRTSSFAYKTRAEDLRAIGQALEVTTILEGSVRKDGERIRVTAQLINASNGYHLWSDTFERDLTGIFAIQEEIARAVAGALGVRLGVGDANAFIGAGTKNVEAYEAYLKGYSFWDLDGESIRLLETATRLDPNYAAAWAELGIRIAHLQWGSNPEDAPAIMERAHEKALRAVELDPTSGRSWTRLGTVRYARFDWIGGEEAHLKALSLLSDRMAREHYGNLLMRAGRLAAADAQFDAAMAAEPTPGSNTIFSWFVSLGRGQIAEAKQRLAQWFPAESSVAQRLVIALNEGDRDEIKSLLAAMHPEAVSTRALYGPVLRDFDSPETALATLRAIHADDSVRWPSKLNDIALLAAYFGDAEFALQVIGEESRLTLIRVQSLWYPVMSKVRRLPGFKVLVSDIKLVPYWRAYGWADDCRPLGGDDFSCE